MNGLMTPQRGESTMTEGTSLTSFKHIVRRVSNSNPLKVYYFTDGHICLFVFMKYMKQNVFKYRNVYSPHITSTGLAFMCACITNLTN